MISCPYPSECRLTVGRIRRRRRRRMSRMRKRKRRRMRKRKRKTRRIKLLLINKVSNSNNRTLIVYIVQIL